jgi:hypothetical protein
MCAGIHGLALYCYERDSIQVTLAGQSLVQFDSCQPYINDGIVFNVVPIYLPQGFYEFEYTLLSKSTLTYMMAAVLPESVPHQPKGLISYAHKTLYMPAAINPLIGTTSEYNGTLSVPRGVRVVDLPPGFSGKPLRNSQRSDQSYSKDSGD